MSIAHMTLSKESIFGKRQFVATLHFCGKRISTLLGDSEPTATDLEQVERRLKRNLGRQVSNYVSAEVR